MSDPTLFVRQDTIYRMALTRLLAVTTLLGLAELWARNSIQVAFQRHGTAHIKILTEVGLSGS